MDSCIWEAFNIMMHVGVFELRTSEGLPTYFSLCSTVDLSQICHSRKGEQPSFDVVLSSFLSCGDYNASMTENESEPFIVENRLMPIFDGLVELGWCSCENELFYWNPKVRFLMEKNNIWFSQHDQPEISYIDPSVDGAMELLEEIRKISYFKTNSLPPVKEITAWVY